MGNNTPRISLDVAARIKKTMLLLTIPVLMTACGGGGGGGGTPGGNVSGSNPIPVEGGGSPISPGVDAGIVGTTYYVATNGSDTNPGTLQAPFRSIQHVADIANPGDTIEVREGKYGGAWIDPPRNPVPNAWITLKPYNHEPVTITSLDNPGG